MLCRFHFNLFAKPASIIEGEPVSLRGREFTTLRAAAWDAYLPVTFEQALAALAALPRMDAEPDGFFVIAGAHQEKRWQVDGHLFDFGDRLYRVELHGECPQAMFNSLLTCFGWPMTPLMFELVLEGITLDEAAFRQWAAA